MKRQGRVVGVVLVWVLGACNTGTSPDVVTLDSSTDAGMDAGMDVAVDQQSITDQVTVDQLGLDQNVSDVRGRDANRVDTAPTQDVLAVEDVPSRDVSVGAHVEELTTACTPGTLASSTCRSLRVSCSTQGPLDLVLREYPAAPGAPARGTILLASGGAGTDFYANSGTELSLVQQLTAMGFTVLDRAWQGTSGWFEGTGGLSAVTCRLTELLGYIRTHWTTGALCATGNSGGSVEVAYAITRAGAASLVDFAATTAGPFHRLDLACGSMEASWTSACASLLATQCPSCDATRCGFGAPPEIRNLINQAYGGSVVCTGDPATVNAASLVGDSVTGAGADPLLGKTVFAVGIGTRDPSGLPAYGLATEEALRVGGATTRLQVVNTAHNFAGSTQGVDTLVTWMRDNCVARP